ncbi:monocarboxylate transporter 10 [Nematostella vectensis]|nr:monocarboxylate transporter 10 [Nematostella vectensis]
MMGLACLTSKRAPKEKDSWWSFLVCVSASISTIIILGFSHCFAVVMPVLLNYFNDSRQKIAWVGSITQCLTFFASPLAGLLIGKLSFRVTAVLGSLTCCISLVLTSFTKASLHIFFSYSVLYGLGSCLFYMSCVYAVAEYFEKRRGLALGFLTSGISVGVLAQGPVLQVLLDAYGWRITFRIMAGVVGLALFLVLTFDPNVQNATARVPVEISEEQTDDFTKPQQSRGKCALVSETLRTPAYIIALVTLTLETLTAFVSYVHLVKYCMESGIPEKDASELFIFIGACALASSIVSGRVLDIKSLNPFFVNQFGAVSMGMSMVLLPLATQYTHFVIFSVFLGLGIGCCVTTLIVLVLETVREELRVVAYPIGQFVTSAGNAAGAPLAGFIADLYGSYDPSYYTAGSIMLLAAFVPLLQYCFKPWRQTKHQQKSTNGSLLEAEKDNDEQAMTKI